MRLYLARLIDHYRSTLAASSFRRVVRSGYLLTRNSLNLAPLVLAPQGSSLRRLVKARPEIFSTLLTRYLAANWDVPTRVARIVDHCRTIDALAGILDFQSDAVVDLLQLDMVDPRYRV